MDIYEVTTKLIGSVNPVGESHTDGVRFARALCDTDDNWHIVYQTENGTRTGNWRVWNEAGEEHQVFPKDHWLPKEIFTEVWLTN